MKILTEDSSYELSHFRGGLPPACEKIKSEGGNVVREAGPMKHGKTILAFVEDPDGYKIELLGKRANG